MAHRRNVALFMDMGTGKTPLTISLIRDKWIKYESILPTVIFCPIITLENWRDEFTKWTRLDAKHIGIVKGTPKKRISIVENSLHKVIIINYEALRSRNLMLALEARKFKIAVCDESHRIKNYKSVATRAVLRVTKDTKTLKCILSGTPYTNSITDLWAQYLFMDSGRTFGNRLTTFKSRYMVNNNADWQASGSTKAFPDWQVNKTMLPELRKKIRETSARVTTEEAVDLPELVTQKIDIALSPEQRKHYDEVVKDLITWLEENEDNPLVVKNALTKLLRLNEISSGFMKLYDGSIHKFKTNPRLDAVIELIENSAPHKIIIFCIFKENYKDLRAALDKRKIGYVEINGEVSTDEKLAAAKEFNSPDGGARVCIANTRSAGLGVNLIGARYKAYYTRNFSLDDYLQSQKRNNRAGAVEHHETIYDYHLVAPNTIDEQIYERLIEKKEFSKSLLDIKEMLT